MRFNRFFYVLVGILFFVTDKSFCQKKKVDLLDLVPEDRPKKEFVTNAFKSTRVISGQSMEFLGAGVLDFRILHRFGLVNEGVNNFYGFDEAKMRLGLDYGISRNLMFGIGRSTLGKEVDGFLKFRPVSQSKGPGSFPFSIVMVTSMFIDPTKAPPSDTLKFQFFTSRLSYYGGLIIGRKFSERFSLQFTPEMVHRNLVDSTTISNDVYALGIGARFKLSRRVAFVVDYHYIAYGLKKGTYSDPLSIGFDIETGGHVFQLHFSNSQGMNERALLLGTTDQWNKGAIRFGFNLSRVFTISKHKSYSNNHR
jgi:opacity protein-like surface antigen